MDGDEGEVAAAAATVKNEEAQKETAPPAFRKGLRLKERALRLSQPRTVHGLCSFLRSNDLSKIYAEIDAIQPLKVLLTELAEFKDLITLSIVSNVTDDDPSLIPLLKKCVASNNKLLCVKVKFRSNPQVIEAVTSSLPRSVKYLDFTDSYIHAVTPELIHVFREFIIRAEPLEISLQCCGISHTAGRAIYDCLEAMGPFMSLDHLVAFPFKEVEDFPPFVLKDGLTPSNTAVMTYLRDKAFCKALVGQRLRVWWQPTTDPQKSGFAGRYWPAKVLQVNPCTLSFLILYDNSDQGYVNAVDVFPESPYVWGGGLVQPPAAFKSAKIRRLRSAINRNYQTAGWSIRRPCEFPKRTAAARDLNDKGAAATASHSREILRQAAPMKRKRSLVPAPSEPRKRVARKSSGGKSTRGRCQAGDGRARLCSSQSFKGLSQESDEEPLAAAEGGSLKQRRATGGASGSPPSGSGSRRPSISANTISRLMVEDEDKQLPSLVLLDFDSLVAKRKSDHKELRSQVQAAMNMLIPSPGLTLADWEFLLLMLPQNRIGNVLFPGEICEYCEGLGDTADPSDYLVIVDAIHSCEPHYSIRYIFHDETEPVRARSTAVRRAIANPWSYWRDGTLARLRRLRFMQEQFHVDPETAPEPFRESADDEKMRHKGGPADRNHRNVIPSAFVHNTEALQFFRPRTSTASLRASNRTQQQACVSPRDLPLVNTEDFALWFLLQMKEFGHPLLHNERLPASNNNHCSSDDGAPAQGELESLKAQVMSLQPFREEALELREKFAHFTQKVEEIKKLVTCCVCLTSPLSMLTQPCGHLVTCWDCAERLDSCPMCREKIKKRISVTNFSSDGYETLKDFIGTELC